MTRVELLCWSARCSCSFEMYKIILFFVQLKKKLKSVIGHQIGVKPSKGRVPVCLTYCVQIERVSFEN